ncbi:hypothetical protein [Nocardia arthritidis]|uniref:Uncharacterized protein n=1 Tax=Nocardia arthritidis TaxID=228602 RepID=A0A6G9YKJ8_9NOCA|nr:hypothetical protein [Nocardia arthritidis]QIS13680.1 hypothetical protein F5544_29175 [Nocardia arthritidis]
MNFIVVTYAVYVIVSLAVTFWVARTLHRTGARFLVDVMNGDTDLAQAVNHLLVIGFWLVNAGFVALALRISGPVGDARVAIEELAMKLGMVLLVLGGMHFANLIALNKIRRGRHQEKQTAATMPVDGAWLA